MIQNLGGDRLISNQTCLYDLMQPRLIWRNVNYWFFKWAIQYISGRSMSISFDLDFKRFWQNHHNSYKI